jgi:hypothetical protein
MLEKRRSRRRRGKIYYIKENLKACFVILFSVDKLAGSRNKVSHIF